jgi:hypothetical protein
MESGTEMPTSDPCLADLLAAIDRYRRRLKGTRSHEEAALDMIELRHGCDLLELEFSEMAGSFARTDLADQWGSVSPTDWIRHQCKMSGAAASDAVDIGEHSQALTNSVDAVESGQIGFGHLALMARTAEALSGSHTASPFDERPLLEKAQESSVGRFWYHCKHYRHMADAEAYAREEMEGIEARRLRLKTCQDGSLLVDGWMDPIGGAALRTALEPLARLSGKGDDRSRERRLADALIELATYGLNTGQVPQHASHRTHLQLTATLETLRQLPGCPAGDLQFSVPISAKAVERLSCDCTLTRIVLGSESVVIDVGRAKRIVPGATRKALNARDAHCVWPGCDRKATWSEAHHLVHWNKGGATDLSNLVLLCYWHHILAHEGGWQLVHTEEGRLLTLPPLPPGMPPLPPGMPSLRLPARPRPGGPGRFLKIAVH